MVVEQDVTNIIDRKLNEEKSFSDVVKAIERKVEISGFREQEFLREKYVSACIERFKHQLYCQHETEKSGGCDITSMFDDRPSNLLEFTSQLASQIPASALVSKCLQQDLLTDTEKSELYDAV